MTPDMNCIIRAYGAVYKTMHRETHFTMAAKIIAIEGGSEEIEKEIEILKKCKMSNIVSYFGTVMHNQKKKLWVFWTELLLPTLFRF